MMDLNDNAIDRNKNFSVTSLIKISYTLNDMENKKLYKIKWRGFMDKRAYCPRRPPAPPQC
jgi:hypothetical protein